MTLLTPAVRAFLAEPRFAVAATIGADSLPHQTVIWYMLDGDDLVMNTPQASVKHKHLLRDPRLSVCVEDGFQYVTLFGTVTLSDDPGRQIYGQLGQRYEGTAAARPEMPPTGLDPKIMALISRERITIRMKIERVIANGLG